ISRHPGRSVSADPGSRAATMPNEVRRGSLLPELSAALDSRLRGKDSGEVLVPILPGTPISPVADGAHRRARHYPSA
ncbi:hypothetical protein AB4097_19455, partial [Microvirga sp. 2MCAF35]